MKRGMTMIELLVAIILTSIMAIVIFQFVQEQNTNYQVTREKIKLQSDAREGIRIMEQEIRNAGFRVSINVDEQGQLAFGNRDDARYANLAWVDPVPEVSSAVAYANCDEKIEFKAYTPKAPDFTLTNDNLWRVGYCWNKKTQTLSRQAVRTGSAFTKTGTWVPMLENVQSIAFEYGQTRPAAPLLAVSELNDDAENWDLVNASKTATTTSLELRDDGSEGVHTVVFKGKKLLSGITMDSEGGNTYRVKFTVTATEPLLNAISGLGPEGTVKIGFYSSGEGPVPSDLIFGFRPALTSARTITYDMALPATFAENAKELYFSLSYTTLGATTEVRSLTLTNFEIQRVSSGVYTWLNASDAKTQMNTVSAVRLKAAVQGEKNGLMNFDRIIPVVNNETR